MPTVVLKLFAW